MLYICAEYGSIVVDNWKDIPWCSFKNRVTMCMCRYTRYLMFHRELWAAILLERRTRMCFTRKLNTLKKDSPGIARFLVANNLFTRNHRKDVAVKIEVDEKVLRSDMEGRRTETETERKESKTGDDGDGENEGESERGDGGGRRIYRGEGGGGDGRKGRKRGTLKKGKMNSVFVRTIGSSRPVNRV